VRRGEIWTYLPVLQRAGQSLHRLVLTPDDYNAQSARVTVLTAHVVDVDPGDQIAVRVDDIGWATLGLLEATPKRRLAEKVGEATPEQMTSVARVLGALLPVE
jgi:mRNA-degrading endonuclease toxin of MazEF toxin-antitoxin module